MGHLHSLKLLMIALTVGLAACSSGFGPGGAEPLFLGRDLVVSIHVDSLIEKIPGPVGEDPDLGLQVRVDEVHWVSGRPETDSVAEVTS
ncbi:MAG TPA: hypothetical protein VE569_02330 [Acidimicrobiia bacterium]|jgi:hypothetical protein|nr:hypothetical protein [Acidimicrobiia bacterium]